MKKKLIKQFPFLCQTKECPKHQDRYNVWEMNKKLNPSISPQFKPQGCHQLRTNIWLLTDDFASISEDEISQTPLIAVILPSPDPTGAQRIGGGDGVGRDIILDQIFKAHGNKPLRVAVVFMVRGFNFHKTHKREIKASAITPGATQNCFPYLEADIDMVRPEKILICGIEPAQMLLPIAKEIAKLRREEGLTCQVRGVTYPVQVTFNPYLAAQAPVYIKTLREDAHKLFNPPAPSLGLQYRVLRTIDEVAAYFEFLSNHEGDISTDVETRNLYRIADNPIATIQFATDEDLGVVLPYQHWQTPFSPDELLKIQRWMKMLLSKKAFFKNWVAHNAKFENMMFKRHFGSMMNSARILDTQAMGFLLDETRSERKMDIPSDGGIYTLKQLALDYLNFRGYDQGILAVRSEGSLWDLELEPLAMYGATDAVVTLRLKNEFIRQAKLQDYERQLMSLTPSFYDGVSKLVAHIEINGFPTDIRYLRQLSRRHGPFDSLIQDLEEKMKVLPGFYESNQKILGQKNAGIKHGVGGQIPWVLEFGKPDHQNLVFLKTLDLDPVSFSDKTERPAIDEEFYEAYREESAEVQLFERWAEACNMRDTFLNKILERIDPATGDPDCKRDQRIRCDIHTTRLVTGRFAHVKPNVAQIPAAEEGLKEDDFGVRKAIKDIFTVMEGYALVQTDYKVNEVRWAAILAKDSALAEIFNRAARLVMEAIRSGDPNKIKEAEFFDDIHRNTASEAFGVPIKEVTKGQRKASKCVEPDTLVYVDGRWERIGNLDQERGEDITLPLTGGIWTPHKKTAPLRYFYSKGVGRRLTLITSQGVITCSPEHRLQMKDGSLKEAQDLKVDDLLALGEVPTPKNERLQRVPLKLFKRRSSITPNERAKAFIEVDSDVAYVLGLYTGDGTVAGENGRQITIATGAHGKYLKWQEQVKESLEKVGFSPVIRRNKINSSDCWSGSVYIGGQLEASFFRAFGLIEEDENKKIFRVPDSILNSNLEVQASFLAGLLDSDGSVSKNGRITLSTRHHTLLRDLSVLLTNLKWSFNIIPHWNEDYKKHYFLLEIGKGAAEKLREICRCDWKRERLIPAQTVRKKSTHAKVKLILESGEGPLVDVEIQSEDHLYVANTFVTHNCITFGILFQQSAKALAATIGVTEQEAIEFQEKFFARMTGVRDMIDRLKFEARTKGFVEAPHGRRRRFWAQELPENYPYRDAQIARNSRQAVNSPIQGIASDSGMYGGCVSLLECIEKENRDWHILMVVHDSCLTMVPIADLPEYLSRQQDFFVTQAQEKMSALGVEFNLPLGIDAEVGIKWGSLTKWNGTQENALELQAKVAKYWQDKRDDRDKKSPMPLPAFANLSASP